MNISGHAQLAEEVGLPVLVDAFEALGYPRRPLNAYAMGNWLTDVQQVVDPVAADPQRAKEAIRALADELVSAFYFPTAGDPLGRWLRERQGAIERVIREQQGRLDAAVDALFAPTGAPGDRSRTVIFDAFRTMFCVLGYFRYVHPTGPEITRAEHEPPSGDRMNADAYFHVYQQLFTPYYPHDHLDRPEIRPPVDPTDYRSEVAQGPRARGAARASPDLYAYLREDIEIAAGRITLVEQDWAQNQFDLGQPPAPDDPAWNLLLARLGRTMHALEDFFAHSNFTEHAVSILGGEHLPRGPESEHVFALRMLRWQRATPGTRPQLQLEPHVVTGWFDLQDTLISLIHVSEQMLGFRIFNPETRVSDAWREVVRRARRPDIVQFEIQQLFFEASELLADPQAALRDQDNSLAQRVREAIPTFSTGTVSEERVRRMLELSPIFQSVPARVKQDILNTLVILHTTYQVGHTAYSAYQALKALVTFIDNPVDTVLDWLSGIIGDEIRAAVRYYVQERVLAFLGARRVGCHSLLAKDEELSALYQPAWNLAAAVDWYVMQVLTRQSSSLPPPAGRQTTQHVDWLDLLEHFLTHPRGGLVVRERRADRCETIVYIVDNNERIDSLATLAPRYAPSACHPGRFNWRTIADANFGTQRLSDAQTQRVVNNTLRSTGRGYVVRDQVNYAWKPGTPVLIPDQRVSLTTAEADFPSTLWWHEVITRRTWEVLPGYTDPERRSSQGPLDIGYTPRLISPADAIRRITEAEALRQRLERAYR